MREEKRGRRRCLRGSRGCQEVSTRRGGFLRTTGGDPQEEDWYISSWPLISCLPTLAYPVLLFLFSLLTRQPVVVCLTPFFFFFIIFFGKYLFGSRRTSLNYCFSGSCFPTSRFPSERCNRLFFPPRLEEPSRGRQPVTTKQKWPLT